MAVAEASQKKPPKKQNKQERLIVVVYSTINMWLLLRFCPLFDWCTKYFAPCKKVFQLEIIPSALPESTIRGTKLS